MSGGDIESIVRTSLYSVAPDLESEEIDPELPFNAQFEFDSMDFLNFVIALNKATGLALPERDYPRLTSLSSATAYLSEHLSGSKAE
ncbi:acyl carrier protein [Aestuariivirga sp.]|uniref:acyl carrier protein n=1 Tax=Aestuariivirga sp. TaxID=2650926 RepID=UPI00391D5A3D